jgi:hypothetical protein
MGLCPAKCETHLEISNAPRVLKNLIPDVFQKNVF